MPDPEFLTCWCSPDFESRAIAMGAVPCRKGTWTGACGARLEPAAAPHAPAYGMPLRAAAAGSDAGSSPFPDPANLQLPAANFLIVRNLRHFLPDPQEWIPEPVSTPPGSYQRGALNYPGCPDRTGKRETRCCV
ncbi:MAG: hypothetical protein Kow00109_24160 [Acidobacteriota bacterium]